MSDRTKGELAALSAVLRTAASRDPIAAMLAMMEALVDAASGFNPALKDFMRARIYRVALEALYASGKITATDMAPLQPFAPRTP